LALLMLFTAVELGVRVPGSGLLDGFYEGRAAAHATASPGGFVPLRDDYVAVVLGHGFGTPGGGTGSNGVSAFPASHRGEDRVVLDHPFTNDNVADAITIPSVPFTATTNTTGASKEAGEPANCAPLGGTVWYQYTPPQDVNLFADTFGTSYADALDVYEGTAFGSLTRVGCNQSATGNAQVGFHALAGNTYWFQITGLAGGGNLVFDLAAVAATTLADLTSSGDHADAAALTVGMSENGRFLAITSYSNNLGGDYCPSRACTGIFVRDLVTGQTTAVISMPQPTASPGLFPDTTGGDFWSPHITNDGRYVSFSTGAALLRDDTNDDFDVYVVDRSTNVLERDSVASSGAQGDTPATHHDHSINSFVGSKSPTITPDGRYVEFTSDAPNLVPGDTNGENDVFVRDRLTGSTELISVAPSGRQMSSAATEGPYGTGKSISPDGRFVAFWGAETQPQVATPEPLPHSGARQVYVRDRLLGTTTLASPSMTGGEGNLDSYQPSISADGHLVAFASEASNLVPGDTNNSGCPRVETDTCGTDYFQFDLSTRRMSRVSVSSSGEQQVVAAKETGFATDANYFPAVAMSSDGRWVLFRSNATNLVPGDPDGHSHIYAHDVVTGATIRVSVSSTGEPGNDDSPFLTLAGDGSVVAFISAATNLAPDDKDNTWDVFVRELR
ncbi:MAG: hypothetical protein QOI98_3342, partial [Solirubrobacteraceae bacterium]|nr:hypothetical protein [Solirubrobacteraceae bacterium]